MSPPASPTKAAHHGLLGSLEHVAHVVASKSELAAHDIEATPGGLVDMAKTEYGAIKDTIKHPWNKDQSFDDWLHGRNARPAQAKANRLASGIIKSTVASIRHPTRDPFATLTTVLPLLHGAGRVVDVASKGALSEPRLLKVGDAKVPLHASTNPGYRAMQAVYDKVLQHGLDTNPEGRVAQHATKRVAGSIAETERYRQRMRSAPAALLDQAAHKLLRGRTPGARRVRQAALELTSVNTAPEEAAAFHEAQAAAGLKPELNAKAAELYRRVASEGMLTKDRAGNVVVNHETHPALAAADAHLAAVQHVGDKILIDHGVRAEEVLAARRNAPARIRAGGTFSDQPVPDDAKIAAHLEQLGQLSLAPRTDAEAVGKGFVGGESARPGRGFVSYKTVTEKAPRSPVARSRGPVIGETRAPIGAQQFTGRGIEQGLVPKDVSGAAAQHFRQLARFVNTSELRKQIAATGTDTRRTSRDVLVRVPGTDAEKLSQELETLIGRKQPAVDTAETLSTALAEYRDHLLPDLKAKFANDKRSGIGTKAPAGHRWVDEKLLGPLTDDPLPRGKPGKAADWLNSAVTSATVYLKPGHLGTRYLTNMATNVIQGSWSHSIGNRKLWDTLTPGERVKALAASGQHSFSAMPHEGTGRMATIASKGSAWWARHADLAFRFNSLAYEARRAGFDTPAKFKQLLKDLESHGEGMNAAEWAKADWVAKRANRANIAYDRLNPAERRYLARAVWFYPFIKGSAMFGGHTLVEHAFKSAVLGQAGVQGRKVQEELLGDLPSYEGGLIPLTGGDHPLVTDFSTFSPAAGAADLLSKPEFGSLAELLNPTYGAIVQAAMRQNQYGEHTNMPFTDALATLVSPTPEAQIIGAKLKPTHGMFDRTWKTALERALAGPATPRRVNLVKAAAAAQRERAGR